VRGIQEGNGIPKDSDLWVTYSNNKEDIWVSHIPVPVRLKATRHASGGFAQYGSLADMTDWNLYIPLLCPVRLAGDALTLADEDPYDYARAERLFPPTACLEASFDVTNDQVGRRFSPRRIPRCGRQYGLAHGHGCSDRQDNRQGRRPFRYARQTVRARQDLSYSRHSLRRTAPECMVCRRKEGLRTAVRLSRHGAFTHRFPHGSAL